MTASDGVDYEEYVAADGVESLGDHLAEIKVELAAMRLVRAEADRDEYKNLVLREENEKLKRGLLGQKAERLDPSDRQLSFAVLEELLGKTPEPEAPRIEQVRAHERRKPTGRTPLPEHLARVEIEMIPLDVQQEGSIASTGSAKR